MTYSLVAGQDSALFTIDAKTGALAFLKLPAQPHNDYHVTVKASDGIDFDTQNLTINVAAAKMAGSAAADTFVFHPTGTNQVSNFDVLTDFLQFDKSMFTAATSAAVLAGTSDDGHGGVVIQDSVHDNFQISGLTLAQLAAHADHILFV